MRVDTQKHILPNNNFLRGDRNINSVEMRAIRARYIQLAWLAGMMGAAALMGFWIFTKQPTPVMFLWMAYLFGMAAILYQPRYGVYLIAFFTLVGDVYLTWQYPFSKNFSSIESAFYLGPGLIFSPLETYIVLTFASWLVHSIATRKRMLFTGPLFKPVMIFFLFVLGGLAYGFLTHGDMKIALWEARPIFYMVALFVLASNLFTRREHSIHLMWFVMAALFIEGVIGTQIFLVDLKGNLTGVNQITEHAVAIHINSAFVFAAGLWFFRTSNTKRFVLLAALPVMFITYLATQRRASYLTLGIAFGLMAILLYQERRKLFWLLVPPLIVAGILYVGAFWNSQGALGKPVQALKSIVAPSQVTIRDQSSNVYRYVENINLSYTIHQKPITGVGFGQKFYVIVPMADISFFEWWQYLPHNSIIWIWLKTGVFGFIAMLYMVSAAIMQGAQTLKRAPRNEISAVLLAGSLYLLMHFMYAYADISWDTKSMVYVGTVIGIINALPHILAQPLPANPKRWPWQPEPEVEPVLLPLNDAS